MTTMFNQVHNQIPVAVATIIIHILYYTNLTTATYPTHAMANALVNLIDSIKSSYYAVVKNIMVMNTSRFIDTSYSVIQIVIL